MVINEYRIDALQLSNLLKACNLVELGHYYAVSECY